MQIVRDEVYLHEMLYRMSDFFDHLSYTLCQMAEDAEQGMTVEELKKKYKDIKHLIADMLVMAYRLIMELLD